MQSSQKGRMRYNVKNGSQQNINIPVCEARRVGLENELKIECKNHVEAVREEDT